MDINVKKSCFIYINVVENVLKYIIEVFGVSSFVLDDGFKYLGYFLKPNSYRVVDWLWLVKIIEKRINIWAYMWLSMGGRLVFIKVVLQNIHVYWSTLAKLHSFIKKRIRQIITNLLWKGAKNPYGFHLTS